MRTSIIWGSALGLALILAFGGCSSDDDKNPTNGGSTREFASGNLANGQSYTHVFKTAKSVPYYCRYHGGAGGVGMSGVITVTAGGTPSKHNYSITGNTLTTATIDVNDTVTWTNNDVAAHTVESDN